MFNKLASYLKYQQLSQTPVASSSNSSTYSDNIELSNIKTLEKEKLFYNIEEEDDDDCTIFHKCKLNIILSIVLAILLFLIFLEFKFLSYRKNQPPQQPVFNKFDFNSIDSNSAPWKLDTNSAYKMDPDFVNQPPKQVREYNFDISQIEALPDGVFKNLTVINGQFPGPLVECNSGDTIVINVKNVGVEPTTIHFHGIYQNGTNYYDGSSAINQCDIGVNQSMTYKFEIDEDQWGTYWYHSHFSTQYADGLFGPFIIHSPKEEKMMKQLGQKYDEDVIVIFNDWYHNKGDSYLPDYLASGNENTEPTPDNGLIQGSGVYDCGNTDLKCDSLFSGRHVFQFQKDKKYRLRLINAGFFAEIDFSIDNHYLKVIEGDGTNVHDLELDVLRIAVLQRYSVILETNHDIKSDSNLFYMRAKLNPFCFAYENPNLDLDLKLIISINDPEYTTEFPVSSTIQANTSAYGHPNVRCRELNETLLVPLVNEPLPEMEQYYQIDSSFQIRDYAISLGYMNDVTYKPLVGSNSLIEAIKNNQKDENEEVISLTSNFGPNNNQLTLTTHEVKTVDILINNYDDGAHPFHLHGYKFWVLKFGQGYFKPHRDYDTINDKTPMKRDTVNISGFGYVLLRVVLDNPGIWPLHCHIGWHMEAGLAMQVNVLPDVYQSWDLPKDWEELCTGLVQ